MESRTFPRPLTFTNNIITYTVGSRVQSTPLYQYADTISWTRGKHAFKGGVEVRFGSSKSQQGSQAMPLANFGAGGIAGAGNDNRCRSCRPPIRRAHRIF